MYLNFGNNKFLRKQSIILQANKGLKYADILLNLTHCFNETMHTVKVNFRESVYSHKSSSLLISGSYVNLQTLAKPLLEY